MSLRKEAISGVRWTSISSAILAFIGITQLSILTHFLSPTDYGLMAIVMAVIGFGRIFSDMGISNAIIHKQNTTHDQLSSLYWLNVGSGVLLFLIVSGLSSLVSGFYNQPELTELLVILSTTFIIIAFGNQFKILFQKELRFDLIAKIEITSAVGAFIVAVICAVSGGGVYAIVFGSLAAALVSTGLYMFYGMKVHRPSFTFNVPDIRFYLNFGLFQMGENTVNYLNSQFDVILIGKLLGVEELGIYSVAKSLSMRPAQIVNPIITRVAFPVMAKVKDDTERLRSIYLKIINYLSTVNFPIYIAISILAEPIVLILFGEKWAASIIILQILAIYGAVRSISNPIGSLQLAKGRADMGFYWNLGLFFLYPTAIYIGSNWGLVGVAYAIVGLMFFLIIPGWYLLVQPLCGAGLGIYLVQIIKPMILSAIAGGVAFATTAFTTNSILQILYVGVTGMIIYGFLLIKFNRSFVDDLKEFRS